MDIYDFGGKHSQQYKKTCDCGKVHEVSTQTDEFPECHTDIFIKCDCGKSVAFKLPVN